MEVANEKWQIPLSISPTNKRANKKNFIPAKGTNFLFSHPQTNSLVVDIAQPGAKVPQYKNATAGKESKRLDLFGRKIYPSSTLSLSIANYAALLRNHDFHNYYKLTVLREHLTDNKTPIFEIIGQKHCAATRTA